MDYKPFSLLHAVEHMTIYIDIMIDYTDIVIFIILLIDSKHRKNVYIYISLSLSLSLSPN